HVKIDATGPVNEVALFNHKLVPPVLRLQTQTAVMNKISTQRSASTAGRGILGNVVRRRKEPRVRARRSDFECLTRERMTSRSAVTRVNIRQQRRIDVAIAQVGERANGNYETRQ